MPPNSVAPFAKPHVDRQLDAREQLLARVGRRRVHLLHLGHLVGGQVVDGDRFAVDRAVDGDRRVVGARAQDVVTNRQLLEAALHERRRHAEVVGRSWCWTPMFDMSAQGRCVSGS